MAFADPQTVEIDTVDLACALTLCDGPKSIYEDPDGTIKLTISHQKSKGRVRRMVRIDRKIVAADPLTSVNEYKSLGVYCVIDEPEIGFTAAEVIDVIASLSSWLTATPYTNVPRLLGGEH